MTESLHDTLGKAIRTLLRPLARILLRNGLPVATLVEYAKQAYVDVAASEFTVPGRKPSVSRVSVLTGLTRKDVSRLMKQRDETSAPVERYHRAARVLTAWVREQDFRDPDGEPRALPVDGPQGFAELVRRHAGDVPHRAVLDELVRVGAVARGDDGKLRLLTHAYVPRTGEEDKLAILGSDVADLVASIDHNLTHPPEEAFFQRKVAYDNLVVSCLPALRADAAARSQALLEHLDSFMAEHDRDANPEVQGSGRHRAVLSIHYLEHPFDEEEENQ